MACVAASVAKGHAVSCQVACRARRGGAVPHGGGVLHARRFGGAKEESDDEDVPDHDLDADGKPLSRIELLKRQNKRLKQAKRRAANAKAPVSQPTAAAVAQGSNQLVLPATEDLPPPAEGAPNTSEAASPPTQQPPPAEPEVVATVPRSDRNSSDESSDEDEGPGSVFGAGAGRVRAGQQHAPGSKTRGVAATKGSGPFRDSSASGNVEVGADVIKEIFAALSALRTDRDALTTYVCGGAVCALVCALQYRLNLFMQAVDNSVCGVCGVDPLRGRGVWCAVYGVCGVCGCGCGMCHGCTSEVRSLRQELGAVKAELGRMMSHGNVQGTRGAAGGAAAVFAWYYVFPCMWV